MCHQTSPTTAHDNKTAIYKHHHQYLSIISSQSYPGVGDQPSDAVVEVRRSNDAQQKLAFLVYVQCEFSPKLQRTVRARFDGDRSFGYDGDEDGDGDGDGDGNGDSDRFGKGTFHLMFILFILFTT